MKAIYCIIVTVITLAFAACSSSENDSIENGVSLFESMKSTYGIESASSDAVSQDIPSITTEEMRGVLEALRQNSNTIYDCQVQNSNGHAGTDSDIAKKVMMTGEYQAKTRSGAFLENFILRVELNFRIEKEQVYYLGTDYSFSSDLFDWHANGLSLAPVKGVSGCVYQFELTSYVYFKVQDEGDFLVRVPVKFNGTYNFNAEKGTYSFTLSKYNK